MSQREYAVSICIEIRRSVPSFYCVQLGGLESNGFQNFCREYLQKFLVFGIIQLVAFSLTVMSDQRSKTATLCHCVIYGGYQIDFMSSCKKFLLRPSPAVDCSLSTYSSELLRLSSVSETEIIWIYNLFCFIPA
jgi:hypothetical protein